MKLLQRLSALSVALLVSIPAFAADDAHGGNTDPMGLLTLEMIWAAVLFLIFAGILGFFVWPKVLGALQQREQKLEGDLVGAEQARKDADAALAEYKTKIAEAQQEAAKVVNEARVAAEQVAAKVKSDAEQQAQQQKIMRFMPFLMPIFLYSAPSGLTLYICASTFAGIVDSYIVRKHVKELKESGKLFEKKERKPGGIMHRIQMAAEQAQKTQQERAEGSTDRPDKNRGPQNFKKRKR